MKTKRSVLVSLVCYVAILIPTAAGQMLCFGCYGGMGAVLEDHPCCCSSEQGRNEHTCCSGESSGHEDTNTEPTLAEYHMPLGCVDVPLANIYPHVSEKSNGQTPSILKTVAAVNVVTQYEANTIVRKTAESPPPNLSSLTDVVLLI